MLNYQLSTLYIYWNYPPDPVTVTTRVIPCLSSLRTGIPAQTFIRDWNPGLGGRPNMLGSSTPGYFYLVPTETHINFESFHPPSWGRTAGRWMSSQWTSQVRLNCEMEVSLITGFRVSSTGVTAIYIMCWDPNSCCFPYGRDGHQTL